MSMRARQSVVFATLAACVLMLVAISAQPLDGLGAALSNVEGLGQGSGFSAGPHQSAVSDLRHRKDRSATASNPAPRRPIG